MVVRMRANKSHRNNRRSHFALSNPPITKDVTSGVIHLRHRASIDGVYRGRQVLNSNVKLDKSVALTAKSEKLAKVKKEKKK